MSALITFFFPYNRPEIFILCINELRVTFQLIATIHNLKVVL